MKWDDEVHQLALLELLVKGELVRRATQEVVVTHLIACGWAFQGPRSTTVVVSERHRPDLTALLDQVWPEWEDARDALSEQELPPTPAGMKELRRLRRSRGLPELPEALNRRTAMSLVADHSKASPSSKHLEMLGETCLTQDGVVRIRPSAGLSITRGDDVLDASRLARVQGEVVLSERAMASGSVLSGTRPDLVLTVENTGAFVDLRQPPWLLLVHVPGWNVRTARVLIDQLKGVPVAHFGDLDPAGVEIYEHLRERIFGLRWFIPSFWALRAEVTPSLRTQWPEELRIRADLPDLVLQLIREQRWLEQERIVLDARLDGELDSMRSLPRADT